jgi:hypothetical protein
VDERLRNVVTDADRERLLTIILRAREMSASKYHAPFVVVLWDVYKWDDFNATWVARKLEERRMPTLRLSVSVPALQSDSYYIPLNDHPTGKAYGLVANALKGFLQPNLPDTMIHASPRLYGGVNPK